MLHFHADMECFNFHGGRGFHADLRNSKFFCRWSKPAFFVGTKPVIGIGSHVRFNSNHWLCPMTRKYTSRKAPRRITRRTLLKSSAVLAASAAVTWPPFLPAAEEKSLYKIERGRIRQSVIHWCF